MLAKFANSETIQKNYESSIRFSLSSTGKPDNRSGVSNGIKSLPKVSDQRGTQTSVRVGVLERDNKP